MAGQSESEDVGAGVQQPFDDDSSASSQPVEAMPPPQVFKGRLPLAGSQAGDGVELSQTRDGRITLKVRDVSLSKVLALLAQAQGLNIVASNDIDTMISITLNDVPVEEALTAILSVANYTWVERNGIILITSLADSANLPASVQGRQIQVFELDFVSARVVAEAITGFLTPIGKVSVTESDPADNRMTRELVVVEDLPESLARIAAYICQVDRAPRQVLIEAHVLQIDLDDTNKQGVNIDGIVRLCDADITLKTTGFANEAAPQAFLATLEGGDLGHVIELLQTTTDSKTLGSPKLLVLNEQEARLQVGEQLGFKVTTTTETSTLESVQFLDVGVVLSIIPRITRDGRVLLSVKPEVSSGQVNPETGLPEEETTELETDIMLNDGQGMIIGGLIKETDSVTQSKIPWLGDVKGLGWFFRNSEVTKDRVEIIVALVPRIQPYSPEWQAYEQGELIKAGVPLMHGPLQRTYRPWDPVLPDGNRVYHRLLPHPNQFKRNWKYGHGAPAYNPWTAQYTVPPYPLPQQRFYDDGCDPTMEHQEMLPPQEGYMSDELEPMMQLRPGSHHGAAIITDQQ
ncbi:MAG TPA: secretin and TonB N-terminal domain-containing protein [Lacipirellulaceae bacterium]|nr:secretin and TonB N-terminal domain-containing protein [Lacipirellulaceae bacterium]